MPNNSSYVALTLICALGLLVFFVVLGSTTNSQSSKFEHFALKLEETSSSLGLRYQSLLEKYENLKSQNKRPKIVSEESTWMRCLTQIQSRQVDLLQPYFLKNELVKSAKKVLLIDPAYHMNVGDNLLNYGELKFLSRFGYRIGGRDIRDHAKLRIWKIV